MTKTIQDGEKLQTEYQDVWLVFNFDNYRDFFYTLQSAREWCENNIGYGDIGENWSKYYQIYRGTVRLEVGKQKYKKRYEK